MDFTFGRQSSRDFLMQKSESLKASFTGGSSRIKSSASDVKNGLFGGFSNMTSKIDELSNKIGGSLDIEEKPEIDQQDTAMQRPKQRPKKPPLPKRISEGSLNGSVKQFNEASKYETDALSKKRIRAPSGGDINFDEPLYDRQDGKAMGNACQRMTYANSAAQPSASATTTNRAYNSHSRTGIQNPFMNDNISSDDYNNTTINADVHNTGTTLAQHEPAINVYNQEEPRPDLMQRRQTNPFIDIDDPNDLLPRDQTAEVILAGGAVSGVLGSDLLPGIPRVPSQPNTDFLNPSAGGQDLFAITPTSGEALPMPGIDPSPVEAEAVHEKFRDPNEIYDDSDGDSEATEGCDEIPDDVDYHDNSGDNMLHSGSVSSDMSWCSTESNLDELSKECMQFMKEYVNKIFDNSRVISPVDKSRFGEMCQHEAGRLWFARYINVQRVNKKVSETTFFQLVQYFAIVLFESNEHEDYGPAKTLMNMCFTYYHEVDHPIGPSYKHFLYSYLKDQPIWQSIKFWNAAFFDAVMCERSRPVSQMGSGNESEYQENIVFGQLGTFTCNMRAFGLNKDLCLDFLRKQSSTANLRDEQLQMLRDNIERTPDTYYSRR